MTEQQDRWLRHLVGVIRPVLIDKVERDHWQPDAEFRRRRIVVAITLLVGATLLGVSFATKQGDPQFYPLTLGLAAVWAIGSFASGPLHLGHINFGGALRRPILTPIVVGLVLAAIALGMLTMLSLMLMMVMTFVAWALLNFLFLTLPGWIRR